MPCWKFVAAIVFLSFLGGVGIDRLSLGSKLEELSERLAVVEQQTAPTAVAPKRSG